MARITNALAAGLLLLGCTIAASAPASAQTRFCPTRESFFGTVQSVQGNTLIVQPANGHTGTVMIDNNARVNAHGYAMRPGMFVGAFGCVAPNGVFHASEVTLAASPSLYATTITGTVQRISGDQLFVTEPSRNTTGIWVVPDVDDFHVGMNVTGTGMMGSNGMFFPQTINNITTAFVPETTVTQTRSMHPTITLSGVVRRVEPGALIVWEPSRHETGTWIVHNTSSFRVGQNVVATGTENRRGDFYPYSIRP
jgi:hypothetical protein